MKTIRKVMALSVASLIAGSAIAQLNLGLQSSTNAAVNAAAASSSVLQSTQAVTNATSASVNATVSKTADIKTVTMGNVNSTTDKTVKATGKVRSDVSKNVKVQAAAGTQGTSSINGQSQVVTGSADGSLVVDVNGKALAASSGETITGIGTDVRNQAAGPVGSVKQTTGELRSEIRGDVKPVKQAVQSGTEIKASAEVKSETRATVGGQ
jgi:hypothetical protein